MSLHILSRVSFQENQKASFYANRLVLPSGITTDALAQDLRVNFPTPEKVAQLFSGCLPLRGLPSLGFRITDSERRYTSALPPTAINFDGLIAMADEIEAVSVHVFDGLEWLRLRDVDNVINLRDVRLFRLQS
jgi:hypothetical protein